MQSESPKHQKQLLREIRKTVFKGLPPSSTNVNGNVRYMISTDEDQLILNDYSISQIDGVNSNILSR
jgi:hypothetical protein